MVRLGLADQIGDRRGKPRLVENAERDFDIIARDLGLKALPRLSLERSRTEPEEGRFDPAALRRYPQTVLEALHQGGIEPIVCRTTSHPTRMASSRRRGPPARTHPAFRTLHPEVVKAVVPRKTSPSCLQSGYIHSSRD